MKKQNKVLVLVFLLLVLVTSITTLKDVTAVNNKEYKTTIIDENGLEIEVATIRSDEVIGTEEYIKTNVNETYSKNTKIEPKDVLYVKHLIADSSVFEGEQTIDNLYYGEQMEAFIIMNDFATILYDLDEESEYYVAIANTLYDDPAYNVADHCFAYTNMDGDTVNDCIYDSVTGLVYVPKKYTAENKNGAGGMNIQVELLQMVDTQNPMSTLSVKVDVEEGVLGKFAPSGSIKVESIATEFGMKIALDEEARNDITENYFKILVNEVETHAYKYYPDEGIIVLQAMPNTVDTIEISISPDNIDDNVDYLMQNNGISGYATWQDIPVYEGGGTWIVTDMPSEGETWYFESNPDEGFGASMVDIYRAYRNHPGDSLPIYNEASDTNWSTIVDKIWKGGNVDLNNLVHNGTWIQHEILFNRDTTANGVTIPGGTIAWLKCSHANASFTTTHGRLEDPRDGDPRYVAWKIKVKVYKITNDYMIVGMLTSVLGGQAGTGIYKIA